MVRSLVKLTVGTLQNLWRVLCQASCICTNVFHIKCCSEQSKYRLDSETDLIFASNSKRSRKYLWCEYGTCPCPMFRSRKCKKSLYIISLQKLWKNPSTSLNLKKSCLYYWIFSVLIVNWFCAIWCTCGPLTGGALINSSKWIGSCKSMARRLLR